MRQIALYGGEKTKTSGFGAGRRFGAEELRHLQEALEQNTLFYWSGKKVRQFTESFARMHGMPHCVATSSGTAAIHTALAAVGVGPGDEVITSPITDMGSVIGILYQNAIPVFADLDPHTYCMDPHSVEQCVTDRTRAILVVHLAGNPADMNALMSIASRRGLRVVEDCAQSYLARYRGRLVGTIGDVGCFSLNDFKHISAGDGGMCVMNNGEVYRKALRFADKNYDRRATDPLAMRNIESLAPNYRMSELQGAVALAQLDRLPGICEKRARYGTGITEGIRGIPGISAHGVTEGAEHTYWFYLLRVDENTAGVGRDELARALAAEGIPNTPGYISCCLYEYDLFRKKSVHPGSACPFSCREYRGQARYETGMCPVAEDIIRTSIKLPVSEFYTDQDLADVISAIHKVADFYQDAGRE